LYFPGEDCRAFVPQACLHQPAAGRAGKLAMTGWKVAMTEECASSRGGRRTTKRSALLSSSQTRQGEAICFCTSLAKIAAPSFLRLAMAGWKVAITEECASSRRTFFFGRDKNYSIL